MIRQFHLRGTVKLTAEIELLKYFLETKKHFSSLKKYLHDKKLCYNTVKNIITDVLREVFLKKKEIKNHRIVSVL